jgi:uncharacterized protein Usg
MVSRDFRRMVEGYGLTTANILYRLPHYPAIVQSYVWQEYDLHPHFPELHKFLDFWTQKPRRQASLGVGGACKAHSPSGNFSGGRRIHAALKAALVVIGAIPRSKRFYPQGCLRGGWSNRALDPGGPMPATGTGLS